VLLRVATHGPAGWGVQEITVHAGADRTAIFLADGTTKFTIGRIKRTDRDEDIDPTSGSVTASAGVPGVVGPGIREALTGIAGAQARAAKGGLVREVGRDSYRRQGRDVPGGGPRWDRLPADHAQRESRTAAGVYRTARRPDGHSREEALPWPTRNPAYSRALIAICLAAVVYAVITLVVLTGS
jgi:hypothetical protein